MELTEHLLRLSRKAEEQAAELRAIIAQIVDVPVKSGARQTIFNELIEAGYAPGGEGDYGHGTTWSACTRIVEQRQAMLQKIYDFQTEAELLTSIADDLIGQNGRLV